MYEEFDGSGSAPPRSVADPGLLDSVRMSFIGLLSKLSPPADYEPLLEDTRDSGDGSPPCCGEAKVLFSTDDSTISGAVDWHSARQKSFYLNSSSMGACVLNLISTIVGSGILGLPFALSKSGWSLGIFLIFGCSLSGLFAMSLLASCAFKSQPFSIQSVLKDSSMYYCVLVEISQLISCFGACLSYLAVIGGTMSSLVGGLGVSHTIWSHHKIWVVVGFLVVAPACFIDKLDTLKYTSGVSLALISFVAGIIFMFSLDTQTFDPCGSGGDDCSSETHALTTTWDTLRALSIFVFAFSGTQVRKRDMCDMCSLSIVIAIYMFS